MRGGKHFSVRVCRFGNAAPGVDDRKRVVA